jgi:FKBP-type peptidyl-prolyl cis-trans isomerase SlyD
MITVSKVNDNDTVTVDLNHPMAGKQLHFDINVVEVREPSDEEMAQAVSKFSAGCGCGSEEPDPGSCGPGCNCG